MSMHQFVCIVIAVGVAALILVPDAVARSFFSGARPFGARWTVGLLLMILFCACILVPLIMLMGPRLEILLIAAVMISGIVAIIASGLWQMRGRKD